MNGSEWLWKVLGSPPLKEGESANVQGQDVVVHEGLPRVRSLVSAAQAQTREAFGFKWAKRDTFESEASLKRMRDWLNVKWMTHSGLPVSTGRTTGTMHRLATFGSAELHNLRRDGGFPPHAGICDLRWKGKPRCPPL